MATAFPTYSTFDNPVVALVDFAALDDMTHNLPLLAANSARHWALIRNDTDTDLPYAEGWTARPTLYTDILPAGGRLELTGPRAAVAINAYLTSTPSGRIVTTERL